MDRDKVTIGHAQKTQSLLWKEVVKAMAERDNLRLLDGGDSVGMTNEQYKGMLLDELEDWQEVLEMAVASENAEIQKKAEKQIAKINQKLKF